MPCTQDFRRDSGADGLAARCSDLVDQDGRPEQSIWTTGLLRDAAPQQPFEAGWAVDGRLSSQVQLSARQLPPPSVPEDPAQAARSVQPAQRSSQTPQRLDQDI